MSTGSSTGVLTSVLAFQIHHGNLYVWLTGGAIGGAWGGQHFTILDPHGNLVAAQHMDYGILGADDVRQLRHFAVDPNGQVWQLAVATNGTQIRHMPWRSHTPSRQTTHPGGRASGEASGAVDDLHQMPPTSCHHTEQIT